MGAKRGRGLCPYGYLCASFFAVWLFALAISLSVGGASAQEVRRFTATFSYDYERVWEASLKVLNLNDRPADWADHRRGEMVSILSISERELRAAGFFPLGGGKFQWGLSILSVKLTSGPQGEAVTVGVTQRLLGNYVASVRRVSRGPRREIPVVAVPEFMEGRSYGEMESRLLDAIKGFLEASPHGSQR